MPEHRGETIDPISVLLTTFPELRPPYQRLLDSWGQGDAPGPYVVYGDLLKPFIDLLVVEEPSPVRDGILRRVFSFTEQLLGSADDNVANLAYIEILEWQAGWFYRRTATFLGLHARAELDRYFPEWRRHESESDGTVPRSDRELLYSADPWNVRSIVARSLGGAA